MQNMISIIIPMYNDAGTIGRCLRSIKAQSYTDFEVIVADDGSSDDSVAQCKKYMAGDSRMQLVKCEGKGVSAARNTAIRIAGGKWLFFIDSDDWIERETLKAVLKAANDNDCDIAWTERVKEYRYGTEKVSFLPRAKSWRGEHIDELIRDCLIVQTCVGMVTGKLIRRRLTIDNGIFFSEKLDVAEDAEFMLRCFGKASAAAYVPYCGYHYVISRSSVVRSFREDYADRYIKAMTAIGKFIDSDVALAHHKETYYSFVLYHLLLCVVNFSFHPDRNDSITQQTEAFRRLIKHPVFAQALEHVHTKDFSVTRKATLMLIKLRLYSLVRAVALLRQRQLPGDNTVEHPAGDNIKIIVATHKKYRMPKDNMYLPLQVGAQVKSLSLGYCRDNTGDNISELNPGFCELTGLYWAWKNVNAEYIGLVHYRRYFSMKNTGRGFAGILKYSEIKPYLGKIRIFVPHKRRYYIETLYSHYGHTHYSSQLDETRKIIERYYPEYIYSYDKVLHHTYGYMFNMMIMEKKLLNEYCTWLFDILFRLRDCVDMPELSAFQARYFGRISEIIFNVWLDYQFMTGKIGKNEIMELHCVYMEKVNWVKKGNNFLKAKFMHVKYEGSM